ELHLTRALRTRPQVRIRLAHLYAQRGDRDRARREANVAVQYYRVRSTDNLHNHQARLGWADALTFLEQFPEAITVLEESWSAPREPAYRLALARVHAAQCDCLQRAGKTDADIILASVEKGLTWDPTCVPLLNRLLAMVKAGGAEADKVRSRLVARLA